MSNKPDPIYSVGTRKLLPDEIISSGISDTTPAQYESLSNGRAGYLFAEIKQQRHNFKDHEIREFVNELKRAAPECRRDTLSRIVMAFLNER